MQNFRIVNGEMRHNGFDENRFVIKPQCDSSVSASYDSTSCNRIPATRRVKADHTFIFDHLQSVQINTDTLNIWADLGGQHLLYLLQFLNEFHESFGMLRSEQPLIMAASAAQFIMERPEMRRRLRPEIYSGLLRQYYELANSGCNVEIQKDAAERWLSFCMDDEHQAFDWFKENHTSREEALTEAIGNIAERSDDRSRILCDRARAWLLRWYNIKEAAKLSLPNSKWRQRLLLYAPEVLAGLTLGCVGIVPLILSRNWLDIPSFNVVTLLVVLTYLSLAFALVRLCRRRNLMRILLPRLAAGITVGYFALMSNSAAWQGVFEPKLLLPGMLGFYFNWIVFLLCRIFLPLLAVSAYILVEGGGKPGISIGWRKASRIFIRGYSYAILLGVLVSDIFGKALLGGNPESEPAAFDGVVGKIYPEVLLYMAPLAFFIGLFIHLLWEDKALTEDIL